MRKAPPSKALAVIKDNDGDSRWPVLSHYFHISYDYCLVL